MNCRHGNPAIAIAFAAATAALSGCTTMGGNVKGSFACSAPAGVCAPTSKIDDAALAMISGDGGQAMPSGLSNPNMGAMPGVIPVSTGTRLTRSSEKVLRIVFPAHIDRLGQFREATAIHAVVERGQWMATAKGAAGDDQLAIGEQPTNLADLAAEAPEVPFPLDVSADAGASADAPVAEAVGAGAPSAAAIEAARRAGRAQKSRSDTREVSLGGASKRPLVQLRAAGVTAASAAPAVKTPAAAIPVPADRRVSAKTSPLQSIQDQVGSIFAARAAAVPAGKVSLAAPVGPGRVERPANAPAVLSVSEVGQ